MRPLAPSLLLVALAGVVRAAPPAGDPGWMGRAHSHNDYEQPRPLADALENGYRSVEVDVWWADRRILVAHRAFSFKGSLEELYLDPLQERVDRLGSVHGDGLPFHLWIDLKESSLELTEAVRGVLERYPMFASFGDSGEARGPVVAILTGEEAAKARLVSGGGGRRACRDSNRFSESDPPADGRWTWYALRWRDHFGWDGRRGMPDAERQRLRMLVAAVHRKGRKLRLYHTPETETFWAEALAAGVDLVGTDHLAALRRFLERDDARLALAP
jgi:hypothetical protein